MLKNLDLLPTTELEEIQAEIRATLDSRKQERHIEAQAVWIEILNKITDLKDLIEDDDNCVLKIGCSEYSVTDLLAALNGTIHF